MQADDGRPKLLDFCLTKERRLDAFIERARKYLNLDAIIAREGPPGKQRGSQHSGQS